MVNISSSPEQNMIVPLNANVPQITQFNIDMALTDMQALGALINNLPEHLRNGPPPLVAADDDDDDDSDDGVPPVSIRLFCANADDDFQTDFEDAGSPPTREIATGAHFQDSYPSASYSNEDAQETIWVDGDEDDDSLCDETEAPNNAMVIM